MSRLVASATDSQWVKELWPELTVTAVARHQLQAAIPLRPRSPLPRLV